MKPRRFSPHGFLNARARAGLTTLLTLASVSLCLVAGCKKNERGRPHAQSHRLGAAALDVCGLIQAKQMETIIDSPVKETKASAHSDGGLRVSQCYYAAGESSRSVNLSLIESDPASSHPRDATQYWEDTFGRFKKGDAEIEEADKKTKKGRQSEPENPQDEEKGSAPKKIEGIGDEAFWSGSRVGGALYVLDERKNAFVRVSVGGPDNESKKIQKSKELARLALGRL